MPFKDKEYHEAWRKKRHDDNVRWLRDMKVAKGCTDCGYNKHHAALEFDHLRDKKMNITAMVNHSRSAIQAEIDKCEVVCGSCHNIRSYERRIALGLTF